MLLAIPSAILLGILIVVIIGIIGVIVFIIVVRSRTRQVNDDSNKHINQYKD